MTAAQFRLSAPGRDTVAGPADVQVSGGALVLAPRGGGDLLRVPFAQLASLSQDTPYSIRVGVAGGTVIELSGMGAMTTQLLADARDGRADAIAAAMRPLGPASVFSGQRGGAGVELRVHDDALLVIGDGTGPDGASERVSFSFVSAVHTEEYVVTVELTGRPPLFLSRLGRRTSELDELLAARLAAARTRTAAFLGALVPELDPVALGEAAGLLRDGVAVPAAVLDQVRPGLAGMLADLAASPERRAALAALRERGPLSLGFRQVMSAHRAASGVTPWHAPAPAASGPDHGSPALLGQGLGGMLTAGLLQGGDQYAGGFAGAGNLWALYLLGGVGGQGAGTRPMAPRPDTSRGRLTPEADDVSAVTVTGDHPAVLAFVLVPVAGRVVLEILNEPGVPTYVYAAAGSDGLAAVNRALDDAGFQPEAAPALGPPLSGQAAHGDDWPAQLDALLLSSQGDDPPDPPAPGFARRD